MQKGMKVRLAHEKCKKVKKSQTCLQKVKKVEKVHITPIKYTVLV